MIQAGKGELMSEQTATRPLLPLPATFLQPCMLLPYKIVQRSCSQTAPDRTRIQMRLCAVSASQE